MLIASALLAVVVIYDDDHEDEMCRSLGRRSRPSLRMVRLRLASGRCLGCVRMDQVLVSVVIRYALHVTRAGSATST